MKKFRRYGIGENIGFRMLEEMVMFLNLLNIREEVDVKGFDQMRLCPRGFF